MDTLVHALTTIADDYERNRILYQHRGKQGQAQRIAMQAAVMPDGVVEDNYNDEEGQHWLVSSSSEEGAAYKVTGDQDTDSGWTCMCPGFAMRRTLALALARTCKHIQAVRLRAKLPPLNDLLRAPIAQQSSNESAPPPPPLASPQTYLQRGMKRMARRLNQMSRSMDDMSSRPAQQAAFDAIHPVLRQMESRVKAFEDGSLSNGGLPSRGSSTRRFQESMGSITGGHFPNRKKTKKKVAVTRVTAAQREETLTQLSQVEPWIFKLKHLF
jgi:hypothetical protein